MPAADAPQDVGPLTRKALALAVASAFGVHLDEELAKPSAVLDRDFGGRTAREISTETRERLYARFPSAAMSWRPSWNLFRRWAERDGVVNYDEFSFEAYHLIFLPRLEDLADGTAESRQRFLDVTWEVFSQYDYHAKGFSVAFFLDSENNMREMLRLVANEALGPSAEDAWTVLMEQSRAYQMTVHRFFDSILQRSLAENAALLDTVLPRAVQDELKARGRVEPVLHDHVAVLFADFEGFTDRAGRTPPLTLVDDLNAMFAAFDEAVVRHGCDRIKTVGDAYVAVAGMLSPMDNPVPPLLHAAIEVVSEVGRHNRSCREPWRIRVGLDVGNVIGAVVGVRRYVFDIFGDAVNMAARMEQLCEPMQIHVTERVVQEAGPGFRFEPRGAVEVKGKGALNTYYLVDRV